MYLREIIAPWSGFIAIVMAMSMSSTATADMRYDDQITIHESILIEESPVAIWAEFGTFCALTKWVAPVTTCAYDEGIGQLGTVRRINVDGLGELLEVMSVQGPTSYTYEVISESVLATAKYRSTVWAVPGPRAGTAEVHWRTTMDPAAFPDDGGAGMANALSGVYSASLARLKELSE